MTNDNKNPQVISRPSPIRERAGPVSMALIQRVQSNPLSQQLLAAGLDELIISLVSVTDTDEKEQQQQTRLMYLLSRP
jgi:ABC-type molybdenum transport system ATPase subunit/photorepair protein PhrA